MRILVVSDIHGNIEALRAVERAEPQADFVLCLGDIVDYGPAPDDTVAWVRAHALATVRGNHDNAVAFGEDCRSAPAFRRLAVETRRLTLPMLSRQNLAFLQLLPTRRSVHVDGVWLELLHAAPGDPLFQYLPASRVDEWTRAAASIRADLILVGHTHLPVILPVGEKRVVNPGSVGLPRDGDPRASYAVIEDGEPTLRRVPYDVDRTIAALRGWGLPDDVTRSLEALYRGGEPLSPFTAGATP